MSYCNSNVKDQEKFLNSVFPNDLGMVLPKQIYMDSWSLILSFKRVIYDALNSHLAIVL